MSNQMAASMSNLSIPKISSKQFHEFGHCVIENVATKPQLLNLEKAINEICQHAYLQKLPVGSHVNYADLEKKIVNSLHRLDELGNSLLVKFVEETGLAKIASSLLDSEVTLFSMQAFLKPAGFGLSTPPHQDNAYWCHEGTGGITIWMAMDDAGPENGMMKYAKSHNDALLKHTLSTTTPGSSLVIPWNVIEGLKWYQPMLRAGSIAVHHGLVVHYSEANNSQLPRRGFLVNYRSIGCVRDDAKYTEYLSTLEAIHGR